MRPVKPYAVIYWFQNTVENWESRAASTINKEVHEGNSLLIIPQIRNKYNDTFVFLL